MLAGGAPDPTCNKSSFVNKVLSARGHVHSFTYVRGGLPDTRAALVAAQLPPPDHSEDGPVMDASHQGDLGACGFVSAPSAQHMPSRFVRGVAPALAEPCARTCVKQCLLTRGRMDRRVASTSGRGGRAAVSPGTSICLDFSSSLGPRPGAGLLVMW